MEEPSFRVAVMGLLGLALIGLTQCSTGTCPTILCTPEVQVVYRSGVVQPYSLSVAMGGKVFAAMCPKVSSEDRVPGISKCDSDGFELAGVDLGHAENKVIAFNVSIDGAAGIPASASLEGITNSRDCELVCFRHTGSLSN